VKISCFGVRGHVRALERNEMFHATEESGDISPHSKIGGFLVLSAVGGLFVSDLLRLIE
jgi:hypothetical protein